MSQLFRVLLLAAAALSSAGPIPNPAAVVTFGNARFTILTDRLVRLEYALGGFDDLPSLVVVNRALAVPTFTVSNSSTTVRISTSLLNITYNDAAVSNQSACGTVQNNTDQTGGARTPSWPNGTVVTDLADCCALCVADLACTAFIFGRDSGSTAPNCYAMAKPGPLKSHTGRQFGTVGPRGFTASNLQIDALVPGAGAGSVTWNVSSPRGPAAGNLNGTYAALDCYTTPDECYTSSWEAMTPGLLSRAGWSVLDDSQTLRFAADAAPFTGDRTTHAGVHSTSASATPGSNWTWWTLPPAAPYADLYFHAYGSDYRGALAEYVSIAGGPGLAPRATTGPWWSRYFAYASETLVDDVLSGYSNFSIPLNNVVMDMDWHKEPTDTTCSSWGDFDFNTSLVHDPAGFIAYLHNGSSAAPQGNVVGHPLTLSLNLHPQAGITHCDDRYTQFAAAVGFDTSKNATIPCDMSNITFAAALFSVYLDASPLGAVDWWWTDYGGCGGPALMNQQWWSNYLYGSHRAATQSGGIEVALQDGPGRLRGSPESGDASPRRPMVLSRWGGPGTHRYPVGFSGDVFQHELLLDFEIQTTPMAANVLHAWSHDLGGFHPGAGAPGTVDPSNATASELYLRWLQFGAVSPVMRTHVAKCSKYGDNGPCERRIWEFPVHFTMMRDAFYLRSSLVPYLYTSQRYAVDTGVLPVHPLYYDWPLEEAAYSFTHEYCFGDDILVAPISTMVPNVTDPSSTVQHSVWLPPGGWARWDGSAVLAGPTVDDTAYTAAEIPMFVPAGTILPLQAVSDVRAVTALSPDIVWTIWPGSGSGPAGGPASGSALVYEDDGVTGSYSASAGTPGASAVTSASYAIDASGLLQLTVLPVNGSYPGMPSARGHGVQLRGLAMAGRPAVSVVSVTVNSSPVNPVAPGSGAVGWYVAPGPTSLVLPTGALVVNAGSFALAAPLTVTVQLQ